MKGARRGRYYLSLLLFFISFGQIYSQDLLWGTYYGTGGNGRAIAADDSGNVYITGLTGAKDLATPGAQQQSPSPIYLAKFNKDGKRIWCTYYGYNGSSMAIALDRQGNIIITGYTSASFNSFKDVIVTTPGAHQEKFVSPPNTTWGEDAFIAKYSNSGKLLWATLYGGTNFDALCAVATDEAGNIIVAGGTGSDTGFATSGAQQEKYIAPVSGVIAKFSSEGKRLWGTYYGGERQNSVVDISLDPSGNIYITGPVWEGPQLTDPYLYVTPGAYLTAFPPPGGDVAYIAKFDNNGKRIWGTYYGGGIREDGNSIDVDKNYNVYVSGRASSKTGVSTPGTYQPEFGGIADAYLVKLDSSGKRIWSTYFGGTKAEGTSYVKCDNSGNIYLATGTKSNDNIASHGAYKDTLTGVEYDVVLVKFNSDGQRIWSTYYGGREWDAPSGGIAVDTSGNVYITGITYSPDGIATPGSFNETMIGDRTTFIAKFSAGNKDTATSLVRRTTENRILRLYPNPAKSSLNIAYHKFPSGNYTLQAIDMLGREVVRHNLQPENSSGMHSLNVGEWKTGIYLIRLYDSNGFNYEERFVVSH